MIGDLLDYLSLQKQKSSQHIFFHVHDLFNPVRFVPAVTFDLSAICDIPELLLSITCLFGC